MAARHASGAIAHGALDRSAGSRAAMVPARRGPDTPPCVARRSLSGRSSCSPRRLPPSRARAAPRCPRRRRARVQHRARPPWSSGKGARGLPRRRPAAPGPDRARLHAAGSAAPTVFVRMGWKRTGADTRARGRRPRPASTRSRCSATDPRGASLRRTARDVGPVRDAVQAGAARPHRPGRSRSRAQYSLGGPEVRFGAGRPGHAHQGQDIAPPRGRRWSRPSRATVHWVAYQGDGAGHYVVERGADGRDYVFMHLLAGSVAAVKGQVLAAGQPFARSAARAAPPGRTCTSRSGPTSGIPPPLHAPIDPLPDLLGLGGDALAFAPGGEIAQLVEHTTENRGVPGSSPGLATP